MEQDDFIMVDVPGDLSVPNIGLGTLGTMLKTFGFVVHKMPHTNIDSWENILYRTILDIRPRFVGFSIHCTTVLRALRWVAKYKESMPRDTFILFGGPQSENEHLDSRYAKLHNLQYLPVDKDIFRHPPNSGISEILLYHDTSFDPRYIPCYQKWDISAFEDYPIITSHGCPNSCSFCGLSSVFWQPREMDAIIDELELCTQFKPRKLTVWDSNFACIKNHAISVSKKLAQIVRVPWRVNGLCLKDASDLDFIREIVKRGCYQIYIGIERIDNDKLYIKGGEVISIELAIKIINEIKNIGAVVVGSFICGLEHDTEDSVWNSFNNAKILGLDNQIWGLAIPMPKTQLYEFVSLHGHFLKDYRECSFQKPSVAFETPWFSAEKRTKVFQEIKSELVGLNADFSQKQISAFESAKTGLNK